jgi:hypothetical protein
MVLFNSNEAQCIFPLTRRLLVLMPRPYNIHEKPELNSIYFKPYNRHGTYQFYIELYEGVVIITSGCTASKAGSKMGMWSIEFELQSLSRQCYLC